MRGNILLLILIIASLFSSCDMFRGLAGRPTSKDIEQKRQEIELHKASVEKAREDSIAFAQKAEADSLKATEALAQWIYPSSRMGGISEGMNLVYKYYVIIGAYRIKSNALAVVNEVTEKGWEAKLISLQNNMYAIGLAPSNKIADTYNAYLKIIEEPFCPKGAWILLNE